MVVDGNVRSVCVCVSVGFIFLGLTICTRFGGKGRLVVSFRFVRNLTLHLIYIIFLISAFAPSSKM